MFSVVITNLVPDMEGIELTTLLKNFVRGQVCGVTFQSRRDDLKVSTEHTELGTTEKSNELRL